MHKHHVSELCKHRGYREASIVALPKNNFPLYSELIICPQLRTLKVNEPLNKL